METYLDVLIAQVLDQPLEDWCVLIPTDPEWILNATRDLLSLLSAVFDSIGIPVLGAPAFLLRNRTEPLHDREVSGGPMAADVWEARTLMIADEDLPYQWAHQRRTDQVHLARRTVGADYFEPISALRLEDVAPPAELFRAARKTGMRTT